MLHSTCDVLVLDLSLPDGDGLVMLRHLLAQRPDLAIVVLTMHDGALYVQDALAAGARGFVTKSSAPDEMVEIGRASGRERVCQYGESSGVAGQLNKKKMKTK